MRGGAEWGVEWEGSRQRGKRGAGERVQGGRRRGWEKEEEGKVEGQEGKGGKIKGQEGEGRKGEGAGKGEGWGREAAINDCWYAKGAAKPLKQHEQISGSWALLREVWPMHSTKEAYLMEDS